MDLAMAAGFAGDLQGAAIAALQQHTAQQARHQPQHMDVDEDFGELPDVDDLEVAAAAAAAALEVLAPAAGTSSDEDSSSDSDDDDSDSDDDSSSDDEEDEEEVSDGDVDMSLAQPELPANQTPPVRVQLQEDLQQPGHIRLLLSPADSGKHKHGKQQAAVGHEVETDSSPLMSESSEEESSESEKESEEPLDYDQMRDMITKAYQVADEEDDEEGGGGGGGRHNTAKEELGLPELVPLDIQLVDSDVLDQAGVVLSVLEGVVVVQGLVNSAALAEGSVLVLDEQRVPVGRVEEVFGPVMQPFYVLRWAGQGDAPTELAPGARISVLARTASRITPDTLRRQDRPVDYEPAVEGVQEEEEVYFSDDEAEAAYKWKQQAKRKADGHDTAAAGSAGGRGGKQRRRGGGQSNGHTNGPSAALQAHATAGQLSSMLGLTDGHGGRGRGRGRGGGRGGRGRGGTAPEASHMPHPAGADRVGAVMSVQRGPPAGSAPQSPPGAVPPQLMGGQQPGVAAYPGQWGPQGPARPHAPYGPPQPQVPAGYPAPQQYMHPHQPPPPSYPYPGGPPTRGMPPPYSQQQAAMPMGLQQQPYPPQPGFTGYGQRPPYQQPVTGQYAGPQQQQPGPYQHYPQHQPRY